MNTIKIAIDFDGTCVKHDYPRIGEDIGASKILRLLTDEGHKLILNTMRSGEYLQDAIAWFEEQGVKLYGVGQDPDQKQWTESPKCFANLYIDDAALGCPIAYDQDGNRFVDWDRVYNLLVVMGILPERLSKSQFEREYEIKKTNASRSNK